MRANAYNMREVDREVRRLVEEEEPLLPWHWLLTGGLILTGMLLLSAGLALLRYAMVALDAWQVNWAALKVSREAAAVGLGVAALLLLWRVRRSDDSG